MDFVTQVLELLGSGARSGPELAHSLRTSPSTVLRGVRALEQQQRVLRIGKTRGARYALRRRVASAGSRWTLYHVDETGAVSEWAQLHAVERNSYYVADGPPRVEGLFEGVPYFLQDARPAGFLGRAVPAAYPELSLPSRVADWTDEHFLVYLTRRGSDTVGALIVGSEAMDRHLADAQATPVVCESDRADKYPDFAAQAMAGAPPGSSAQGEHPKFTAWVGGAQHRTAVIVKFSPPRASAIGRRWADLLIAEHLAHRVLADAGIPACQSEILEYGGRVFLQSERFDRVGSEGRRSVVSLHAVDTWRYGRLDSWTACADRLASDGLLSAADADRIRFLDAFGALTANTDRHFGNITLFDDFRGPFVPAPAYDTLPMLFAPQSDQLVPRQFEPPPPRSAWLSVWSRARAVAETYWERLIGDQRLSDEFRRLCSDSLETLRALPQRGGSAS